MSYKEKYLKYKQKYLDLKGGFLTTEQKVLVKKYNLELPDEEGVNFSDESIEEMIYEQKLQSVLELSKKSSSDAPKISQSRQGAAAKEITPGDRRYPQSRQGVSAAKETQSGNRIYSQSKQGAKVDEDLERAVKLSQVTVAKEEELRRVLKLSNKPRMDGKIELDELVKLARKYYVPYDITTDTEITLNEKIFMSPVYKKELQKDEEQHRINVNRELALFYNVPYNPYKETDVMLQDKIFHSQKFKEQLRSEEFKQQPRKTTPTPSAPPLWQLQSSPSAPPLWQLQSSPTYASFTPTKQVLSSSRESFVSNYQLVRSPGDGSCLYWSLSSAMNRRQDPRAMIEIKQRIRGEYIRVIDKYPRIRDMNSDELFIYLLGIDASNPELERDKQVLLCLAMGLNDTSFMNLPRPPRNPLDYISTFDQMYGGEAEIKMFVELYGIPVLNIDSTRRTAIFYRTPELERLQRREVYANPINGSGEERQLERRVMLSYNELSEEQRQKTLVVSRSGAHYNYLLSTTGEPFIVPDNYRLM